MTWREGLNDQELFMRNSEAVGKLLRASGTGHSAEYYKSQILPILSREDIDKMTAAREAALQDLYKEMRERHNIFYKQEEKESPLIPEEKEV